MILQKKKFLLGILKFPGVDFTTSDKPHTLEEYNKELEEADAEIESGKYVTMEDFHVVHRLVTRTVHSSMPGVVSMTTFQCIKSLIWIYMHLKAYRLFIHICSSTVKKYVWFRLKYYAVFLL